MKYKIIHLILLFVIANATGCTEFDDPITIYLIGDSTMAEKLEENRPETGWGEKFEQFFNSNVVVRNQAGNGRSKRSFLYEDSWEPVVEALKPGDYVFIQYGAETWARIAAEQIITRSDVALVGEHRDSTRIIYAELRSNWTAAADNRPDGSDFERDWGSAVINIGNGASDITIANMTIYNNYGGLYDDRGHQFTIRGFDATRIAILYSTIISDGGDAVALWNRESGMYYHAYSHFEGWVDYVCPRGWAFITHSTFFGHNMTASLWHDGSADKDQKFVIRSSYIDGVPGFPLGRHHRDGQFYFIDVAFSETMADQPIHYPDYSPNAQPWKWGQRHYYFHCTRIGGDYEWFRDNLEMAEGSPSPGDITAQWTFGGRWNPEVELIDIHQFMKSSDIVTGEFPELK